MPVDLNWDPEEEPVDISCGNGFSVVVTVHGNTYTFGNGTYGVLGHGTTHTHPVPTLCKNLLKVGLYDM